MRMFSVFMSRCRIPRPCIYSIARITCAMTNCATEEEKQKSLRSCRAIIFEMSPPGAKRKTMYNLVGVLKCPYRLTMKGCNNSLIMRRSRIIMLTALCSTSNRFFIILSANVMFVCLWRAANTFPNAPCPRVHTKSKSSMERAEAFAPVI